MQYNLGGLMGNKTAEEAKKEGETLVDAGWHNAVLVKVEESKPKQRPNAAPGVMDRSLNLSFKILDGRFANFIVRRSIALDHSNETYRVSSRAFLGRLALAFGHKGQITTLDPFMNKPIQMKVSKKDERPADPTRNQKAREAGNEVQDFKAIAGPVIATAPAAAPAATAPAAAPAPNAYAAAKDGEAAPAGAPAWQSPATTNGAAPAAAGGAPWRS